MSNNKRQRLSDKSPTELLRMLCRAPKQPFRRLNVHTNDSNTTLESAENKNNTQSKKIHDPFEKYEKLLQELKESPSTFEIRPPIDFNFKKRRNRHLEDVDSVLSERTFHTSTNYSGLDHLSDLDSMSVATQDLLPREETGALLDRLTDRISVISEQFSHAGSQRKLSVHHTGPSQDIEMEIEGLNSDHFQSSLSGEEDIKDEDSIKDKVSLKDEIFKDVMKDDTPEENRVETEEEQPPVDDHLLPVDDDDFGDDINFGYAGIEEEILEEAISEEIVDKLPETQDAFEYTTPMRINRRIPSENNFARKRIFEATGEKILSKDDAFNRHHVKQVFTNKIATSKRVSCNISTFAMVADVFCDQLVNDLLAYKKNDTENEDNNSQHQDNNSQNEESDDEVHLEDIMLLMRRQRVLSEQNSLESLIYKHLPRELWDDLAVSALADNLLSDERVRLI